MLDTPRTPVHSQSRAVPWMLLPGLPSSTRQCIPQAGSAVNQGLLARPPARAVRAGDPALWEKMRAGVPALVWARHACTGRGRGRRCVARRMTRLIHAWQRDSVQQAGIGQGADCMRLQASSPRAHCLPLRLCSVQSEVADTPVLASFLHDRQQGLPHVASTPPGEA